MGRLKYIFVGSFAGQAGDGSVGGQLYACRTLMNSPISEHVAWTTIDSTMASWPPPPLVRRIWPALRRLMLFLFHLLGNKDGALIFSAAGAGFIEKGLMAVCASQRGIRVVLAPRSGHLKGQLEKSARMRRFAQLVFSRCDRVICQGQGWKDYFMEVTGLEESRFTVIKNWIDAAPYLDLALPDPEPGNITVLFVGMIERLKGALDLVEAAALHGSELQGVRFILCGRGAATGQIKERLEQLGLSERFEFPGWVTGAAKMEYLERADIFVLPSHAEGMPNALIEAMAAGRAAVATRVGGIPDVVVSDDVGRLVPAQDPDSLGAALAELASDPGLIRSLGQNARRHILDHHDIHRAWPALLNVLKGED